PSRATPTRVRISGSAAGAPDAPESSFAPWRSPPPRGLGRAPVSARTGSGRASSAIAAVQSELTLERAAIERRRRRARAVVDVAAERERERRDAGAARALRLGDRDGELAVEPAALGALDVDAGVEIGEGGEARVVERARHLLEGRVVVEQEAAARRGAPERREPPAGGEGLRGARGGDEAEAGREVDVVRLRVAGAREGPLPGRELEPDPREARHEPAQGAEAGERVVVVGGGGDGARRDRGAGGAGVARDLDALVERRRLAQLGVEREQHRRSHRGMPSASPRTRSAMGGTALRSMRTSITHGPVSSA